MSRWILILMYSYFEFYNNNGYGEYHRIFDKMKIILIRLIIINKY